MALVKWFEDIKGWQKARELTTAIYRLSSQAEFARDFGLKDQIRHLENSRCPGRKLPLE